jgi:predicted ribosomally synthesized peptide with SipW-like signal peptide
MTKHKRIALSLLVVVAAAAAIGAGTFATFSAQTRNPGNVFASGTLVLSDTKSGGSACLSTGGGTTDANVNNNCDQLLSLTVKKPGDSGSANLTVKNDGTVAASALRVFEAAACADADAPTETYHGTGSPCGTVQLYVQQYSDAAFSTPSACLYGGGTANACDFSDAAKTLAAFRTSYSTSGNGLAIGSGLAAGSSVYLKVAVQLPSTADNTLQGRQATFDLTWFAQQ